MVASKLRMLAGMAALSLVFLTNVSQAAFVSAGTLTSGMRSVQYAVYQRDSMSTAPLGISLALNDYVYLYQVLAPSIPPTESLAITAGTPNFSMGVVNGMVFGPNPSNVPSMTNFVAGSTNTSAISGQFGLVGNFNISPAVTSSPASGIMYLISSFGPGTGSLMLSAPLGSGGDPLTLQGPVPVPLPPALALMMLGLPMVGLIRRRLSK